LKTNNQTAAVHTEGPNHADASKPQQAAMAAGGLLASPAGVRVLYLKALMHQQLMRQGTQRLTGFLVAYLQYLIVLKTCGCWASLQVGGQHSMPEQ
jgi:hypothetical protein